MWKFLCGALVWDLRRVHWYFMFTPTAVLYTFQRGAAYSDTAVTRKSFFFFLSRHILVFFVFSFLHEKLPKNSLNKAQFNVLFSQGYKFYT